MKKKKGWQKKAEAADAAKADKKAPGGMKKPSGASMRAKMYGKE